MRMFACLLPSAAVLSMAFAVAAPALAQGGSALKEQAAKTEKRRLATGTIGSFTPNGASRDFGTRLSELEKRFSFTPSESKKAGAEKITVGLTRRIAHDFSAPTPNEGSASRVATRASAVGAGVDVGYAGFSLTGDYNRGEGRIEGSQRERVDVGFGYAAKEWRADVRAGASQPSDANLIVPEPVGEALSVELGGAYAVSSRLAVKGGVRYDRIHPEAFTRDFVNRDAETAKDTGTVYLGTSFSF
ncbi:porin [Pacificimonas flava]|uniref:Uncharacterized protein n=1 Tax=Pacificimonas flava TaxID=1234595 RepID=M2U7M3_9SPHN|nr:porin [Pacificimonas flava]EMD83998.1 hypothetical protein C725_0970 [Pacificimonas flava]MBB5281029.1 hypothetical protein [Pacificimonas flava]